MLGPEKLPRVVSELGRWVGRARAMARQFREQLEEEVQLEEARKAQPMSPPSPAATPPVATPPAVTPPAAAAPASADPAPAPPPELEPPRPKTFSHAHPTDDTGADVSVRTPASASADEQRS